MLYKKTSAQVFKSAPALLMEEFIMTKDLTNGKPFRVIVSYLFPVYLSLLMQSLYGVVDAAIVGQTLGADAMGGISATGNLNSITLGFFTGINSGFCIPIAQAFGASDNPRMRKYVTNGALLCACAALISVFLLAPATDSMLRMLKTTEEHFPYAISYLQIIFLGAPFSLMYNFCGGIIRSLGDSKMPTVFLALSAVVNIVLDLIFILVFHSGTAGAALATVLSQAVAGFSCLIYIARKIPSLHFSKSEWKVERSILLLLLSNGIPMGIQSALISIGPLVQRPALNSLGTETLNALSVTGRINAILLCPISTLGHSIGYYYGQNVGAHKPERIRQGFRIGILLSTIFCILSTIIVFLFAAPLTRLFLQNPDSALIEKTRISLLIINASSVLCGLCATYKPAIQATGYASLVLVPGLLEMGIQFFGAFILIPRFGFIGANLSTSIAWLAVAVIVIPMAYCCLNKQYRKHISQTTSP